jgi:hypothetical protein
MGALKVETIPEKRRISIASCGIAYRGICHGTGAGRRKQRRAPDDRADALLRDRFQSSHPVDRNARTPEP